MSGSQDELLNLLPDSPTYEQYREFAEDNLSSMPDPEGMAPSQRQERARAGSPSWSSAGNGIKTFYDGYGDVFLNEAIRVIDVSSWQENIDWNAVRSSGVDAAILRLGYGVGHEDRKFARNVSECRKYGVPFGVYFFSYAYSAEFAAEEGGFAASVLKKYGLDKDMPVFYDLEEFPEWDGHFPPTSTNTYVNIANQFFSKLEAAGYTNLQVYSGKNYLTTVLNAPSIVSKASWVAQYGPRLKYEISADSGVKGWQYSSSGSVSGIHGNVDMNAFSLVPYWRERLGLYGFVDVFSSTPHHEHIGWLKENGIAAGWADGTFKPYVSIARCDMAAFLYRLAGSPQYSPTSAERRRFKDVDGGTPHCDEVWWLASTGVSTGWADGTFKPYASIARCDMAAFLHRFFDNVGVGI